MKILERPPEEVETIVKENIFYLDQLVKKVIGPKVCIKGIVRNPSQGGRKTIYNLTLSNESQIVLKLNEYPNEVSTEVMGLKYANSLGVASPTLIYFEETMGNPLGIPFLLMSYVKGVIPEYLQDREGMKLCAETVRVDPLTVEQYVQEVLSILRILHKSFSIFRDIYFSERIHRQFRRHSEILIQRKAGGRRLRKLEECFKMLFAFYEDNRKIFIQYPQYHLHGDLDISNILLTEKTIVLIDWELYHMGDCAEDLAYFANRIILSPICKEKALKDIEKLYSQSDPDFPLRFKFYLALDKMFYVTRHGYPLEEPLNYMKKYF